MKRKNADHRWKLYILLFLISVYMGKVSVYATDEEAVFNLEVENQILLPDNISPDKMKDKEFVFELEATEEGIPMPTVKEALINGAGTVKFDTISFDDPGTYHYLIRQKTQGGKGWIIDSKEYQMTIFVKRNAEGQLLLTVWGNQEGTEEKVTAFRFENTYREPGTSNPPSKTNPPTVKTGDSVSFRTTAGIVCLSMIGIVLFGSYVYSRMMRRKNPEEKGNKNKWR